jgi:hypothetical protein
MSRKKNSNTYVPNAGGDPKSSVNYQGFIPEPPKDQAIPRSAPIYPTIAPPKVTIEEEEQLRLAKLANEVEMEPFEFHQLALETLKKAELVNARIDAVAEIVKLEPIDIKLDEPYAELGNKLIGTDIVNNESVECLLKIAGYEPLAKAYEDTDPFSEPMDVLNKAYSQDKLDEAFPKSKIKLMLMLLKIVSEVLIKMIFGKLCAETRKISYNDTFATLSLGLSIPIWKWLIKKPLNLSAAAILLWLNETVSRDKLKKRIRTWKAQLDDKDNLTPDKANALLSLIGNAENLLDKQSKDPIVDLFEVCSETTENVFNFGGQLEYILARGIDDIDESPIVTKDRCSDPEYVPTITDKLAAEQILQSAMEKEMGAETSVVNKKPKTNIGATNYPLNRLVNLRKSQQELKTYSLTGSKLVERTSPSPGFFVTDKISAEVLGFFANINALAQRLDAKVTGFLSLEFIDKDFKQWLCCVVRLLYIIIPKIYMAAEQRKLAQTNGKLSSEEREYLDKKQKEIDGGKANLQEGLNKGIFGVNGDNDPNVDKSKKAMYSEFQKGNLSTDDLTGNKAYQEAKKWVMFLDAIIVLLTSNLSMNLNVNLKIFSADFIKATLKVAIAEAGSYLMTYIHHKVDDGIMKAVQKMEAELPEMKMAIDMCEPFKWLMNILTCSIQNMFAKMQEILGTLWADGKKFTDSVESSINITVNNKSLGLFHKLLEMLLKWDTALINLCALNKITTPQEEEEIINRFAKDFGSTGSTVGTPPQSNTDNYDKFKELLSKADPVFHPGVNLQLDGSDPFENGLDVNPLIRNRKILHLQMLGYDPTIEAEGSRPEVGTPHSNTPEGEMREIIKGCGDRFKALLRDREQDIINIQKSVFQ